MHNNIYAKLEVLIREQTPFNSAHGAAIDLLCIKPGTALKEACSQNKALSLLSIKSSSQGARYSLRSSFISKNCWHCDAVRENKKRLKNNKCG